MKRPKALLALIPSETFHLLTVRPQVRVSAGSPLAGGQAGRFTSMSMCSFVHGC